MKQFESQKRCFGYYRFIIRPLPAFTAANISGDLFGTILPMIGSLAPIIGANGNAESLMDMDSEVAAKALAKGASSVDGDKVEYLLKKLLVQHGNISYEPLDGKEKTKRLTEDDANEIFCGDVQDMFVLAFDVMKSNYSSFFEKLANLFGDRIDALLGLVKKTEAGLTNTAN